MVENRTVYNRKNENLPPNRKPYSEIRPREYLTDREIAMLIKIAKKQGRYGQRDATMILMAYRHGLRVSELCTLRWDDVDFSTGLLHVRRLKRGIDSVHPLRGVELRALRQLYRETKNSPYLFVTERGAPMSASGFRKMFVRRGKESDLTFPIHPHMLRHACGFKLANDGQDTRAIQHYLGHRNIKHTVRYTELSVERFKDFWGD
ncbi:MAG: tyrosine-type recombinase/integrase [Gammaproteobacteria bacterium]|nr:tyrosine-type recombinase/integrase [Gammaproteobacteria bacterium]NNJ84954.1 tyrosine-type recombinase/integrase [Gammaproteobacteria bacterium]